MIACMSRDPKIMGLCGETKIANKGDTWVTAIQGMLAQSQRKTVLIYHSF